MKRDLRRGRLFRIWGHKLFSDVLWRVDKKAIAGGLSLGLFVAFMPALGFQMLLATIGALYFKVNLPIALAACWVTNPLTAVPIYTAAWGLGRYIIADFSPFREFLELHHFDGKAMRFMLQAVYLSTGSFVFSIVSAISANVGVRAVWRLAERLRRSDDQPPDPC